jgi:methyl-accepting chemotaxis protein
MKLKIRGKLLAGFAIVLALMIASAVMSYFRIATIREKAASITEVRLPTIEHLRTLQDRLDYTAAKARQTILAGTDPVRRGKAQKAFEDGWEGVNGEMEILEQYAPYWTLQVNRDKLAAIKEKLPEVRQAQQATMNEAAGESKDAVIKGGNDYADKVTPVVDATVKSFGDLVDSFDEYTERNKEELNAAGNATVWTLLVSAALALVAGLGISIVISHKMSTAAISVLKQAEAIASGDLSGEEVKITSADELGDLTRAINKMHASLREVIESIAEHAQNVANASEEFSAVSQQISANSEETSAQANTVTTATEQVNRGLQTIATSTEEMTSSIKDIAKNATEAAKVADSAMKTATETNAIVAKLGTSSAEIGQVIKVITSIAQKTDLLALNATVEAARAGEVGAGFAVVANEVKELAKQTANATEDISRKIEAIQADAKSAVAAIASISGVIGTVNDISGTIATAVEEQSATTTEMSRNVSEAARGAGEVSQNIQGVAEAAQSTSQGATDSEKASRNLAQMSTRLRELVARFKLQSNGKSSGQQSYASKTSSDRHARQQTEQGRRELAAR